MPAWQTTRVFWPTPVRKPGRSSSIRHSRRAVSAESSASLPVIEISAVALPLEIWRSCRRAAEMPDDCGYRSWLRFSLSDFDVRKRVLDCGEYQRPTFFCLARKSTGEWWTVKRHWAVRFTTARVRGSRQETPRRHHQIPAHQRGRGGVSKRHDEPLAVGTASTLPLSADGLNIGHGCLARPASIELGVLASRRWIHISHFHQRWRLYALTQYKRGPRGQRR